MQNLLEMFSDIFAPKKAKTDAFAVVITEESRTERYIKAFRKLIREYPYLQQNPSDRIKLSKLEYGDVVVFGTSSSYDYTIIEGIDTLMKLNKIVKYDLISDESRIAQALDRYVEKNSICPCFRKTRKVENDYDVEITVVLEEKPKPKKIATIEIPDFYDAFVKIGWNIYYTVTDTYTGKQYVTIDGEVFQIKTNLFGQKYLG